METLADYGQRERDVGVLTDYVRLALREQICFRLAAENNLSVFVLAPELEEHLGANVRQNAGGSFLAINPTELNQVQEAIRLTIAQHHQPHEAPVLVCAQDIRRHIREMMEPDLPELVVLALTELTSELAVNVIATVESPI
jgi:type III secretion protein V